MRLGGLSLDHKRTPVAVVGARVLTLILHLENSITGGTLVFPRAASLPGRNTTAVLAGHHTTATLPGRLTRAALSSRTSHATLSSRNTRISDTEWLQSP